MRLISRVLARAAAVSAAAILFLAAVPEAVALEQTYRLRADQSALRFSYAEDGEPKNGRFARFNAVGRFDPDDLSRARLTLTIATASVDLNDAFRTTFVQGSDWFDSAAHPDAVYRLDGLIRLTGDQYIAVGSLRLKGVEKRLSSPLTLTFDGAAARAKGDLTFDRRDFNIGGGPAALFVDVGEKIQVAFDLKAEAAR